MEPNIYYAAQQELCKSLLKQSRTFIAVNKEDPDQIFGYITYEPDYQNRTFCIHYIYVKQPYRRFGIASMLIKAMQVAEHPAIQDRTIYWFTHMTSFARYFKGSHIQYNPYIVKGITCEIKSFIACETRDDWKQDRSFS